MKDHIFDILQKNTFPDKAVQGFLCNVERDKAKDVEILRAETETAENMKNMDPVLRELKLDRHNTQIPIGDVKGCFRTSKIYHLQLPFGLIQEKGKMGEKL
ncbi:uncharacterized protein LOC117169244 [Belonocnema kinseyi]|uniref:uncharacterized protein LOC117169244 n=1 Tax=Belonocnema kinseyi TaxID=2817044 RepID=UPI00143D8E60|nr:uncharacterized protein LOC117169244 [Belonocnema kinseyi]